MRYWLSAILLLFMLSCTPRKEYTIGFSQCCIDPWRDVMEAEMARELNFHAEVDFRIRVAENNSEQQVQQIRELIDLGIDILIVAPNESAPLTPVIEEVYASGIPVILIDRKTDSDLYTAYLGADNYEIGKTAGEYIANKYNGKGKIVELNLPMLISPAIERNRGFGDAINHYEGLDILPVDQPDWTPEKVNEFLPAILEKYPELDIIFAHTDQMAEEAYKVAQQLGRQDSLFFVGVDGIPGTGRGIQAVEDGVLDASMLYPTGGGEAIQLALSIINNLPYEKQNKLQTTVIEPSNARILHFQMKKVAALQENIDRQISWIDDLSHTRQSQRVFIFVLISSLLSVLVLGGFLWKLLRQKQEAYKILEDKNEEILEKQEQILEMSAKLRKATQAKVDFFTNISHEFRTPLTLIVGFIEDLLPISARFNKDTQLSVRLIKQNAFRLLRLVNQLMDFRKIESDKMKVKATENDLIEFVRNIMGSYNKVADKRKIDFQLIARHENFPLWFDVNMLDKVLFNLLSNAFKYTPDEGRIHLAISIDHFINQAKIVVEDSGEGMTEEEASHVFEPFYQGEEQHQTGTGLGLPLSQALVKLHYGDIGLETVKDKGSRFTISIPLGKDHFREDELSSEEADSFLTNDYLIPPEEEEALKAFPTESKSGIEHKILVIEDSEDLQFFMKRKLGSQYEIIQAIDGDIGQNKAFEETPDLIICDIMLPGRNGLEIAKTLKSDLRTCHIPIILLTAQTTMEQQIAGIKTGADAYLTKPFNFEFLRERIKNLLHNRHILKESYGHEIVSFKEDSSLNPLDRDFVNRFVSYVEEHYARQDFQVNDLCRELNLSRSQLYRKAKALLGRSISDYIQNARLKKAEELLLEGEMPISEIAYEVGYSSPDYFSTVFRSKYNVAPSQYKFQARGS